MMIIMMGKKVAAPIGRSFALSLHRNWILSNGQRGAQFGALFCLGSCVISSGSLPETDKQFHISHVGGWQRK